MSEPAQRALDVVVPALGESISEAVVAKWLKEAGAAVAVDEPLVELETDKVTVAVPSPTAGVLAEQCVATGATVKVGEVVARIRPGAATVAPAPPAPAPTAQAPAPAPPAPASPAPAAAPAPSARSAKTPDSAAPVRSAKAPDPAAPEPIASPETTRPIPRPHTLPPSVRRAIREGVTAPEVAPAGPATPTASATRNAPATPAAAPAATADEEIIAMSPLRKRIAQRLVEAQHTAAILTTFNEVDMSAVIALRARFQDEFTKQHGVKLGFMSFFARACVESLRRYPGLNAEIRGDSIVYKKHYDFGIAVGSGKGLVVPVVRDVGGRSLAGIERAIADLAAKAKDNRLTLDDLSGGTFSLTNGGIYGSMMSTPLLNLPQTGILGMHAILQRPVAVADAIALRPMMYLAVSYDHRVVDGREAVQFLVGVKQRIEAPERLLLDV